MGVIEERRQHTPIRVTMRAAEGALAGGIFDATPKGIKRVQVLYVALLLEHPVLAYHACTAAAGDEARLSGKLLCDTGGSWSDKLFRRHFFKSHWLLRVRLLSL